MSWGLYFNLGFTFTGSHNGLPGSGPPFAFPKISSCLEPWYTPPWFCNSWGLDTYKIRTAWVIAGLPSAQDLPLLFGHLPGWTLEDSFLSCPASANTFCVRTVSSNESFRWVCALTPLSSPWIEFSLDTKFLCSLEGWWLQAKKRSRKV